MSITLQRGDVFNLTTGTVSRALTDHQKAIRDLRSNDLNALRMVFRKGL